MEDTKRGFIFKTVVVGDGAVGKTSLVQMFTDQKFSQQYIMTIGSNFALKLVPGDVLSAGQGKAYPDVRLQLWDLAGQPIFTQVRLPFYKGASGIIFVYDVTRPETMNNLQGWREEIIKQIPEDTPCILLGNKIDLEKERKVSPAEGEKLAKAINAKGYFETSARNGTNVNHGFQVLARAIIDYMEALGKL